MFEKSDQKFLKALDSQEDFEKRLKLLRWDRKIRVIFGIFSFFAAIVMFIMNSRMIQGLSPEVGNLIMLLPVMLLFFPLICLIQASHANSQIRTLLTYKKLRDTRSID